MRKSKKLFAMLLCLTLLALTIIPAAGFDEPKPVVAIDEVADEPYEPASGGNTPKVGDILGEVKYTDIVAYINGAAIPAANINGDTYVAVEDLGFYGFDWVWDGTNKAVKVTGWSKDNKFEPKPVPKETAKTGDFKCNYLYTNIKAYVNDKLVDGYNIGGETLINFNELSAYGKITWDGKAREIRLVTDGGNITSGSGGVTNSGGNGTTVGNLVNRGISAISGDWIYYRTYSNGLNKIKTDGTGKTVLLDRYIRGNINVVGDWIYYTGDRDIYKIKIDGTGNIKIPNTAGATENWMSVAGDWIYYTDFNNLYKIRTDGKDKQTITELDNAHNIVVDGDWAYYSEDWVNDMKHYKVKTDGTGKTQLPIKGTFTYLIVENGRLYYLHTYTHDMQGTGIYVYDANGKEIIVLPDMRIGGNPDPKTNTNANTGNSNSNSGGVESENPMTGGFESDRWFDRSIGDFNVSGDWVYFVAGETIYKTRTDGTELTEIVKRNYSGLGFLTISGDWIYFIDVADNKFLMHRIKTDGTGKEIAE